MEKITLTKKTPEPSSETIDLTFEEVTKLKEIAAAGRLATDAELKKFVSWTEDELTKRFQRKDAENVARDAIKAHERCVHESCPPMLAPSYMPSMCEQRKLRDLESEIRSCRSMLYDHVINPPMRISYTDSSVADRLDSIQRNLTAIFVVLVLFGVCLTLGSCAEMATPKQTTTTIRIMP